MDGTNNKQQKIACLLLFESLKLLHDKLEIDKHNLAKTVNFSTQGIMFNGRDITTIKSPSTDFTDHDRLQAYTKLDYADGSRTNDYDGLAHIQQEMQDKPPQYMQDIKQGKCKKIVFVLTDG
jgi:hypothetical protein